MPDHSHSLLIDLLAAHDSASAHGCGLEPRLLELLLDRHAPRAGTVALDRPIRVDGPPQPVPIGMACIETQPVAPTKYVHADARS